MEFFLGIVYIIVYLLFMYMIGKSFNLGKTSYSFSVVVGFIVYTALQAIVGIGAQVFNTTFSQYAQWMILLITVLLIWSSYRNFGKFKCVIQERKLLYVIKEHIKQYWFLYAVVSILTFFAVTNITYQWTANHLDDGYYLNFIANAPFYEGISQVNHATGLETEISFIRLINTFELDAAFWSQIFHIPATIFVKYFLTFVNYFLIASTVVALAQNFKAFKQDSKKYAQYVLVPLLLFMYPGDYLNASQTIYIQDAWQFNTAIWYGSSIVRHMGFMIFGIVLLKQDLTWKNKISLFLLTSIMLVSRATQAVPVIYIVTMVFLIQGLYRVKIKKLWKFISGILITVFLIGINLFVQAELGYINDQFQNIWTMITVASFLIVLSFSCNFKGEFLKIWNQALIIVALLLFVPYVNTWFIVLSTYDFVIGRTVTLFVYTVIMTAFINIIILILNVPKLKKYIGLVFTIISGAIVLNLVINVEKITDYTVNSSVGRVTYSISRTIQNSSGIPNITRLLGEELEQLFGNEKAIVVTPTNIMYRDKPHSLAISLRNYSPNSIVLSAIPRYGDMLDTSIYRSYTQNTQNIFEVFDSTGGQNSDELKKVLEDYPIDYVVVTNQAAVDSATLNLDMELASQVYDENVNITMYILKVKK